MSEQDAAESEPNAGESGQRAHDLEPQQAQLAYSIINSLLEHTRIVSDLIALMAQALDEETTKALTNTPQWQAYLDSRRAMERTRTEVEQFTEVMTRLARDEQA